MPNPTEPFNIDKLHAEIGKMWGFHGAHMEIFEMIQSQLATAQEEIAGLKEAREILWKKIETCEHQNQKLREALTLINDRVHFPECAFDPAHCMCYVKRAEQALRED